MTASTDFLPFATGTGANVETQATYLSDSTTGLGYSAGILPSAKLNKVLRQTSFIAAGIANFVANALGINIPDDGNLANFIGFLGSALVPASGGTFTGAVYGVTPTTGDSSTKLATTAFVHGLGVAFNGAGLNLSTSSTLTLGQMGGWAQFQAASLTTTLPAVATVPVGQTMTFIGYSYGGTIKANSAEPINTAAGTTGNTYVVAIGETVTLAANGTGNGWDITSDSLAPAQIAVQLFGVSQSWSDVTASRAFSTNYTNTTGKPINVFVVFPDTISTNAYATVVVGGVSILNNVQYDASSSTSSLTASFIVPPGIVYSVTSGFYSYSSAVFKWCELR